MIGFANDRTTGTARALRRLGLIRRSKVPQTSRKMTGALPVLRATPPIAIHSLPLANTATGRELTMTGTPQLGKPLRQTKPRLVWGWLAQPMLFGVG